jgi:hypothetical protein
MIAGNNKIKCLYCVPTVWADAHELLRRLLLQELARINTLSKLLIQSERFSS